MEFDRQKSLPQVPHIHKPFNGNDYVKTRSRTASSVLLPSNLYQLPSQSFYVTNMQSQNYITHRTPSNATASTFASSGTGTIPSQSVIEDMQRSASSRSSGHARSTSYVALMRKQKATVWCERAQLEDPRLQAQLKAAKIRAAKEVTGSPVKHRTSTSGSGSISSGNRVTAKIRNHGKLNLVGYNPADLVGGVGGVPLRLSASEVEGCDSNKSDGYPLEYMGPRRMSSGRNNYPGYKKGLNYLQLSVSNSMVGKWTGSNVQLGERQPSLLRRHSYATKKGDDSRSTSSGSAEEKADTLRELHATDALRLAQNSMRQSAISRNQSLRTLELKRKGSVDDRALKQNTGRLYIANPDADSD
ncbi:hypothetical protein HI914_07485 [Erysiphe necator]|uniref:Uncharacterized protein n=1 Tax=Uncinula necator TaxID=52586 RepID=A0A0B1P7D9_UNCNE|nr:hypothetical protein HI914_07485 [Erysiphe necator]KHJ34178.1 hypothetical protein EV44_g2557 [Erysiphe necator]